MSLFADYIKEREGLDTIENEHGFLSFRIINDVCYVRDLFVTKPERGRGYARVLYGQLLRVARDSQCKKISCFVDCRAPNAAESLAVILTGDFKVVAAEDGLITLERELA